MPMPRSREHGSAPRPGFGQDIREWLVHGPSIVPRVYVMTWLLASIRRRSPHAGSAYNRGNQVISVLLGDQWC
jgi:hypothetical protein